MDSDDPVLSLRPCISSESLKCSSPWTTASYVQIQINITTENSPFLLGTLQFSI